MGNVEFERAKLSLGFAVPPPQCVVSSRQQTVFIVGRLLCLNRFLLCLGVGLSCGARPALSLTAYEGHPLLSWIILSGLSAGKY